MARRFYLPLMLTLLAAAAFFVGWDAKPAPPNVRTNSPPALPAVARAEYDRVAEKLKTEHERFTKPSNRWPNPR